MRVAEARLTADMADATAHVAAEEEVIRARILQKRQRRDTCALAREQNWAVHAMAGLSLKQEKEAATGQTALAMSRSSLIHFAFSECYCRKKTARAPGSARARAAVHDLCPARM